MPEANTGARLQATSARDLFASQLLSLRTPADVYRAVTLDRVPTYVREEVVGGFRYSLAAAPVRSSGLEGIVTVGSAGGASTVIVMRLARPVR